MIVLLHNILSYEVMDILDQRLTRLAQVRQALHKLLGARHLLKVHDHQFEFNNRFAVFDELRHDINYLLQEVLDLLLLPLLRQYGNKPKCILLTQVLELGVHPTDIAQ